MRKSAVTISDVARKAGVSVSTVSKYLNDIPYVSENTKKKIQAVIDELNFQPNTIARSLAKQETGYLGLLVPEVNNPFYTDLMQAIEAIAAKKGYYIILANTHGDSARELQLARELGNRVDALIFASATNDSKKLNELIKEDYRFLMVSRHVKEVKASHVVVDGFLGAKMAVAHLIRLGHKKIGHIGGPQWIHQFQDRYMGYQSVLKQFGIPEKRDWVVFGEPSIQVGYQLAVQLMSLPEKPTALFVGNDTLALGVLEACDTYGWCVPHDLAIVSFDNISLSRLALVPLTTIDSRIDEMGQFAVQTIVQQLREDISVLNDSKREIVLKPSLVIRKSCGSS